MRISAGARHDFLRRYGIPQSWEPQTLGQLARVVGGGTPSRDERRFWVGGTIPWATPTDLTANHAKRISKTAEYITEAGLRASAAERLPAGSVLFTSRATIGAKAIATIPMATNQGFANFLPHSVDAEYLYYLLELLTPTIKRLGAGTTFDEVSKREIRTVWCALPSHAGEQAAIARLLDAADTLLERTREEMQAAELLADTLREDAVNGRLITPTMGVLRGHPQIHDRLGSVPSGWAVDRLGRACDRIVDGTHQAVETAREGIPFLYVSCIRNGRIVWERASFVTQRTYSRISKGREPKRGSVLYTAVGSYGNAALVSTDAPFSFQRHIAVLYPKEKSLLGGYLALWINSRRGKRWSEIHAVGNAQKTVTLTELSKMLVAYPPPPVQQELYDAVQHAEMIVDAIGHRIEALSGLKRSLLHDLLTGRVRLREAAEVAAS